jgi:3-oxoacyl-[acyl-carrier protein] reductase
MLEIDLKGRVALVLGGSRGIGAGITECLCRAGARVVFTHTGNPRNAGTLRTFTQSLRRTKGHAHAVVSDALNSSITTGLVARIVRDEGRLDILVSNVGMNKARPVETISDEEWREYLDVNLSSAFYGVRAVLPHMMKAGRGRIILIGSSAVYDGGGGAIDYASPKAALRGMMAYLCRNYAREGVHCNVVHPCVIDTDLLRQRYNTAQSMRKLADQIPVGRIGTPRDIGGLVAFLVSPWGDYICGQEILADGGRTFFSR